MINDRNIKAADNDNSDYHNSNGNGNHETFFWNEVVQYLNDACKKIVHWKQNFFMLPSGAAGEKYINNSPLESLDLGLIAKDNCT